MKLFIRGKPYVITVDDILLFDLSTTEPVFAGLSDDGKSIWGAMIEKAYAKILGNYLKTASGFLETGIRVLTGIPIFSYALSNSVNL